MAHFTPTVTTWHVGDIIHKPCQIVQTRVLTRTSRISPVIHDPRPFVLWRRAMTATGVASGHLITAAGSGTSPLRFDTMRDARKYLFAHYNSAVLDVEVRVLPRPQLYGPYPMQHLLDFRRAYADWRRGVSNFDFDGEGLYLFAKQYLASSALPVSDFASTVGAGVHDEIRFSREVIERIVSVWEVTHPERLETVDDEEEYCPHEIYSHEGRGPCAACGEPQPERYYDDDDDDDDDDEYFRPGYTPLAVQNRIMKKLALRGMRLQ